VAVTKAYRLPELRTGNHPPGVGAPEKIQKKRKNTQKSVSWYIYCIKSLWRVLWASMRPILKDMVRAAAGRIKMYFESVCLIVPPMSTTTSLLRMCA
jgi:hypothetical protein